MNNDKLALKSSVWYTISNFLMRSIGFITTPVFTRLLTKAEFGAFNNYTSWLSVFSIFLTLNLHSTLISACYDYKQRIDEYIFSILGLSALVTIVGFAAVNTLPNQVAAYLQMDIKYVNVMFLYLLFLPAVTLFQTKEQFFFEYKKTVLTSVLLTVSTAILSVLLVVYLPDGLMGRILGAVIPTLIAGLFFFLYFLRKGKRIKFSYWKYALPICIPYIPHLLSGVVLNSTDKIMITRFCGTEQTALYSLAYTCGGTITILISSMNQAFAPWQVQHLKEERYADIRSVSVKYVLLFFALVLGIMLISPEVLLFLGGESYMEAVYVLAPVSMGCFFQLMYTLFVNIEQFYKKTVGMAIGTMAAAMVNFFLNIIFIPRFGYLAAAYTTLFGYVGLLVFHMYLVRKLGKSNVLNYSFFAGMGLLGLLIMIAITLLYDQPFVRYCVVVIYMLSGCVLIIKNRENIKRLLKAVFIK